VDGSTTVQRRQFIALLGGAVLAPDVCAAQENKLPVLGILALGNPDPAQFLKEFKAGLRDLGYVEGQNIRFEFRSAEKKPANLATRAVELVKLGVDVLVAFQTPAVTAAKHATTSIPIVMGSAGDPVGTGLVVSLARPGGNITGVSGASAELGAKNLDIIREVLPSVQRVAVAANAPDPFSKPFLAHIQAAGQSLKIEIKPVMIHGADELDHDFAELKTWGAQALIVQPSLPNQRIAELAIKNRILATAPNSGFSQAGGLMSYSADLATLYRQSATYVDKILKGRKPADLPVELAAKFRLIINLKTAKALGVTVPERMLLRADQVIE
jgi:putative ABC transport system substrate-binding protein